MTRRTGPLDNRHLMRRELAAVYDELLRRHKAGEHSVYLSGDSLNFLKEVAESQPRPTSAPLPESSGEEDDKNLFTPADKPAVKPKAAPKAKSPAPEVPAAPSVTLEGSSREEKWANLKSTVLSDAWCQSQVKPGKQVVFGVGSLEAEIFFCGEAPGAEEEIQGEPFVGPAGELLTRIIKAMGLSRDDVYIGNIMNYRPPMPGPVGNRAPTRDEMAYCLPYLLGQLEIIQPKVIVALGKTAIDGLLGPDSKRRMTRIRGQWTEFNGIPLVPTFHPSYLLRNQSNRTKRDVWEDMLSVMEKLQMPISDKQRGYFLSK